MHEYRIQIILAVLLVFLLYKLLRSVLKKKLEIKYVTFLDNSLIFVC